MLNKELLMGVGPTLLGPFSFMAAPESYDNDMWFMDPDNSGSTVSFRLEGPAITRLGVEEATFKWHIIGGSGSTEALITGSLRAWSSGISITVKGTRDFWPTTTAELRLRINGEESSTLSFATRYLHSGRGKLYSIETSSKVPGCDSVRLDPSDPRDLVWMKARKAIELYVEGRGPLPHIGGSLVLSEAGIVL